MNDGRTYADGRRDSARTIRERARGLSPLVRDLLLTIAADIDLETGGDRKSFSGFADGEDDDE